MSKLYVINTRRINAGEVLALYGASNIMVINNTLILAQLSDENYARLIDDDPIWLGKIQANHGVFKIPTIRSGRKKIMKP
jgi:hypothetical protein